MTLEERMAVLKEMVDTKNEIAGYDDDWNEAISIIKELRQRIRSLEDKNKALIKALCDNATQSAATAIEVLKKYEKTI